MISLLVFGVTVAFAQKSYTGKISDENGVAVVGALISGDEGATQVLSDESGSFTIVLKDGTKLLVEAEGFDPIIVDASASNIVLTKPVILSGKMNHINLPFSTVDKRSTTGAVTQINIEDEMDYDQRLSISSALDGKVSGLMGAYNTWGRGNAIVVIDGIPRSAADYDLNEVESVTVLKDPVSRAMYGAQADQGVILVTTKRGAPNKRVLSFRVESGINMPKALPEFLGSADYMAAYNQALINDGGVAKYSNEAISNAGSSPFYPDEDFYSDTYLKNSTNFTNVSAVASGGNLATQYFVTIGWQHNTGWFNLGENDNQDRLNMRGAVDFNITDNLSMKLDGIAVLDFKSLPNISDYWGLASSTVPNAYPVLWDPQLITDETTRESILESANLVDGMLLGGNNTYTQNIYGDFVKGGERKELDRFLQFNTGLDWDLSKITPGLKVSGYLTFDLMNRLTTFQDSKYAVYNPVANEDGSVGVSVIGEDKPASNFSPEQSSATFHRRIGAYGTISYTKQTDDYDLSVVGLAYRDQISFGNLQDFKNHHFGAYANYAWHDKYLADIAAIIVGSQKLPKGDNYAFSPAFGLGWIISEEDFMSENGTFDFLKLRANFGILKNDNWYTADDVWNGNSDESQYFLYETAYQRGGNFFYDSRNNSNEEMNYVTRGSEVGWQSRSEFVLGADAAMLDKKLWIEASFFNTKQSDLITEMQYTYPTLMGGVPFYSNFNANKNSGFDLGIRYTTGGDEWNMTLGSNLIYSNPKITKIEEPIYDDAHAYLSKMDAASDAIWGLEAEGLYGEGDFTVIDYANQDFQLKDGLPVSSYGKVQPGDIKYVDQDGNGTIDNEDLVEIGNNSSRFQYSLYLKLQLKAFEIYALGIGQTGDYNMRSNDYYRFYGELKYPEFASQAYGPANKDVNADYPRLSSNKNNNNYRNSTYWMYENNWFKIPTLQVAYNIKSKNVNGVLKDAKVFVRAADLVTINKNKSITEVNFNSAPQTRSFSIGFVAKF